ncbi:hypothetical protein GCM10011507_01650 [Edaphobacter acidisoli]|uniref:DUF1761 domain-containing protein n=1 Tax=Edaphobacter acidisoli TaxID=2040573 RepID=A0A916VYU4_9BACT|nr:hypothetical protein [Edaphobacter acidisoli]GGA54110.1 hypothetical protein GCM10011507_01650 [Edaphobacter acidisoli]
MITGTFVLIALILGYSVVVGLSMLATFSITKAAPAFVAQEHLLNPGYRILQEFMWLVCSLVGGYVSAWVTGPAVHPLLVGAALAGVLVAVLWSNTWEVAQRGLGHQIVMTIVTIIGVAAGFALRLR